MNVVINISCVFTFVRACVRVCVCARACVRVCVCVCVRACLCVCVCPSCRWVCIALCDVSLSLSLSLSLTSQLALLRNATTRTHRTRFGWVRFQRNPTKEFRCCSERWRTARCTRIARPRRRWSWCCVRTSIGSITETLRIGWSDASRWQTVTEPPPSRRINTHPQRTASSSRTPARTRIRGFDFVRSAAFLPHSGETPAL